jgi:hypothetical protein
MRTRQPRENNRDETTRTGQRGENCGRTGRTGQLGQDNRDNTVGSDHTVQVTLDRAERTAARATAPYFYGSILLRALKSKIIVLLTYMYIRNNVHLINMGKFYFE